MRKQGKEELSLCGVFGAGLCGDYLYCSPRHSLLLHRLLDVLLPNRRRQSSLTTTSVHCMRAQLLCPWLPVMSACMLICLAFGKGIVHMRIAGICSGACLCRYLQGLVALYALPA